MIMTTPKYPLDSVHLPRQVFGPARCNSVTIRTASIFISFLHWHSHSMSTGVSTLLCSHPVLHSGTYPIHHYARPRFTQSRTPHVGCLVLVPRQRPLPYYISLSCTLLGSQYIWSTEACLVLLCHNDNTTWWQWSPPANIRRTKCYNKFYTHNNRHQWIQPFITTNTTWRIWWYVPALLEKSAIVGRYIVLHSDDKYHTHSFTHWQSHFPANTQMHDG